MLLTHGHVVECHVFGSFGVCALPHENKNTNCCLHTSRGSWLFCRTDTEQHHAFACALMSAISKHMVQTIWRLDTPETEQGSTIALV